MSKVPSGKVALVTGGSRGIGAAVAKELASQGATVAISYGASAEKAEAVVAAPRVTILVAPIGPEPLRFGFH